MARNLLFVDTGAWFALTVAADRDHRAAVEFVSNNRLPFVTTDDVVDELLTLFVRRRCKIAGIKWLTDLLSGTFCELVRVEPADFDKACAMYLRFAEKTGASRIARAWR